MTPLEQRLTRIGREFGHGMTLGLERIEHALAALGRPQDRLPPVLHVAGTNGKGSVCAFLRACAEASGLRTHVYTSPHLVRVNERIRLAGRLVEDAALIEALDRLQAVGGELTYFEALTAAAFLLFAEHPADLCILEVGMGGRFDATNVATPALSLLTPVDYDHQEFLGTTLAAIAAEKAGILKRSRPAISARQAPEAMAVIEDAAVRLGAPLWRAGIEWDAHARNGALVVQTQDRLLDLPVPVLAGPHQIDNAGLACAALLALQHPRIDSAHLAAGVAGAQWPARMQPIVRGPLAVAGSEVWLDGGHNAHAARALAEALRGLQALRPTRTALLWGMLARKDAAAFMAPLRDLVEEVWTVPIQGHGPQPCHPPEHLAAVARVHGLSARPASSLHQAAVEAGNHGAGRILIAGSLFLAGEALALSGMAPV